MANNIEEVNEAIEEHIEVNENEPTEPKENMEKPKNKLKV